MARKTVQAALLGQLLAALIAATAVSSTTLARQGVSAPTLQSSLNYLLLAVVYLALHVRAQGLRWKCAWWAYALLALLDVEGNFCLVLAYRYTSLTSVTLLDCFTIPAVVALSTLLLGAAYRRGHYIGAAVCVTGLLVLVLTDDSGAGGGGGSWPLLGDGLVLLGATLYAVSNVLQEWLLGDVPVAELLGTLGAFGCLWSALQGLPLELHTLYEASWDPSLILPFLGFGCAMFAFYSLVPYELKWGGAALLNISLLASDLWAALARYFFFGGFQGNSLLYFCLSLLVVSSGILLFTWSGDVDTKLGAGSALAGASTSAGPSSGSGGGLPVLYHRVPGAGGGDQRRQPPMSSLSNKEAVEALEEMQRQRGQLYGQQPASLPNPFDIASSLRGGFRGSGGGSRIAGFMPLPAVDEAWVGSDGEEGAGSDGRGGGGGSGSFAGDGSPRPAAETRAAAQALGAAEAGGSGAAAAATVEAAAVEAAVVEAAAVEAGLGPGSLAAAETTAMFTGRSSLELDSSHG